MAGLKRGGAAAHERAVVVRDGRGTAGKNTYTRTHTPVSVTHVHTAKIKATLKEERTERESGSMRRGAGAAADLCLFPGNPGARGNKMEW